MKLVHILPVFCLVAVSTITTINSANAGDLKSPFSLETTATLPEGIGNPRLIDVFSSMTTRFNDGGYIEPLGNVLNKTVTWNDILNAQQDSTQRATLAGLLRATGVNATDSPGSTTGVVNTFADVKVAALGMGINDKLTVVGVLPIIRVDVSASTSFLANQQGNQFVDNVASSSNPLAGYEAATKINDAINQKLIRLGYNPIPTNETISNIGDLQIIGKYKTYDDGVNSVAIKGTVILPTGIAPNPDNALDIPTGDGRFGLAIGSSYDWKLPLDFRFNTYGTYTALLPHSAMMRIPTSVSDTLSADKELMYERLRSQFAFGTGIEHTFPSVGIVMGTGYTFQYMTQADYQPGMAFTQDRYNLLDTAQPLQALHSLVVSTGFSTVEWYKAKKFIYPFQVNLSYSHPFAGRNVPANDLAVGELVLFF